MASADWLGLAGKRVLVTGVANKRSIAWHVHRGLVDVGAVPVHVVRDEATRDGVAGLLEGCDVHVCDVERQAEIDALAARLAGAVDRAIAGPSGRFEVPRGRAWPFIGVGQVLMTAALIAGVVWLVAAWLTGAALPAATLELPLLGPMPVPAVLILVGLFGSWLLSRILSRDARRLGRAWAARLASDIRARVDQAVSVAVARPLDEWDDARGRLWRAAQDRPPG